jgi:hypothetical protein
VDSRRHFLTKSLFLTAGTAGVTRTRTPSILNGIGSPRRTRGIVGDFYVDDRRHVLYGPKRRTGWGRGISLIGPAGSPSRVSGPQGPRGAIGYSVLHGVGPPAASLGSDNDFYLDTAATVLYGPKEGGVWGSPVPLTNSVIDVIDGGGP